MNSKYSLKSMSERFLMTQFTIDHIYMDKTKDWLLANLATASPDSVWMSFNDYSNAGFSIYGDSPQGRGTSYFDAFSLEFAKHSGSWAEAEGTNLGPGTTLNWENYLGKIFNHGGSMANLFGGFMGGTAGDYGKSTESDEAIAAYQKFLKGEKLQESGSGQ